MSVRIIKGVWFKAKLSGEQFEGTYRIRNTRGRSPVDGSRLWTCDVWMGAGFCRTPQILSENRIREIGKECAPAF